MASRPKKKIMLLVSNSIKKPEFISADDMLVHSLREIGYDVEIVVFSKFYDLINKLKSGETDLVFNLFENTSDDISIQMHIVGVLEILGIPYIGHNPFVLGLSRCFASPHFPDGSFSTYQKSQSSSASLPSGSVRRKE